MTILASGNALKGLPWREANTSTEVTLRTTSGALGAGDWVIAYTAITALAVPPHRPSAAAAEGGRHEHHDLQRAGTTEKR